MENGLQKGNNGMKTVGKRKTTSVVMSSARDSAESVRAWRKALPTPFVPRGVYRFETHKKADEWMMKMITRPSTAKP